MRKTDLNLVTKQNRMTEAGAYFLDEKYNIFDVFSKQPHRLGFSICSALTHKMLLRAGLISADDLPANRNILPGELLSNLRAAGWIEIPSNEYFDDRMSEFIPLSPIAVSRKGQEQRTQMRSYEAVLDQLNEMTEVVGVTPRDLLNTECMLTNQSVFDLLNSNIPALYRQAVHIQSEAGQSAKHWAEERISEDAWARRFQRNEKDVAALVEAMAQVVEELGFIVTGNNYSRQLRFVIESLREGSDVNQKDVLEVIQSWSKAELEFGLCLGVLSWDLPTSEPKIEWSTYSDRIFEETSDAMRIKEHLIVSFDAIWAMSKRISIMLNAAANASEALIGKDKTETLKQSISSNFAEVRNGYQN